MMPLASGPSRRAAMIEHAKPVASRVNPAAAFKTEFAIMLFVMKTDRSSNFRNLYTYPALHGDSVSSISYALIFRV